LKLPQSHYLTLEQIRESLAAQGQKVTYRTLRYWFSLGLLPARVQVRGRGSSQGMVHLYSPMSVERVKQILEMRTQGFSVPQISRELARIDKEAAVRLVKTHLNIYRPLSPDAHGAWTDWATTYMAETVREWANTPAEKEERLRRIAGLELRKFRLILDTLEYRLRERLGTLDGPLAETIAALSSDLEREIAKYPDSREPFQQK